MERKERAERYHSIEARVQKAFSNGWNFLGSYVYIREKTQQYFNELDTYQDNLTWQNSNQPRHRLIMAGTYELPFGVGRPYMSHMPKVLDMLVGGWKLTGVSTYTTGAILALRQDELQRPGSDSIRSDTRTMVQYCGILTDRSEYVRNPIESAAVR